MSSVAKDKSVLAALQAKIEKCEERYEASAQRCEELEATVQKYQDTIDESEHAYSKVGVAHHRSSTTPKG